MGNKYNLEAIEWYWFLSFLNKSTSDILNPTKLDYIIAESTCWDIFSMTKKMRNAQFLVRKC